MATVISASNGQAVYPRVIERILKDGRVRAPRGLKTLDLGYTIIELDDPRNSLALGTGRKLNVNIAAAEAVQLIGGFSTPHLLTQASSAFHRFAEEDGSFYGAYGSRIRHQTLNAITKLREDPDTRQAIITLWDPVLDNHPGKKDYPCTVALQFEIHDGALHMNTFMRSNDAWLGLPYDLFQFTQLQMTVANVLELDYGRYRHTALSLHIYHVNADVATFIHVPTDFSLQPVGLGSRGENFTTIMRRARRLTVADVEQHTDKLTRSEIWYRERFTSYVRSAS